MGKKEIRQTLKTAAQAAHQDLSIVGPMKGAQMVINKSYVDSSATFNIGTNGRPTAFLKVTLEPNNDMGQSAGAKAEHILNTEVVHQRSYNVFFNVETNQFEVKAKPFVHPIVQQ